MQVPNDNGLQVSLWEIKRTSPEKPTRLGIFDGILPSYEYTRFFFSNSGLVREAFIPGSDEVLDHIKYIYNMLKKIFKKVENIVFQNPKNIQKISKKSGNQK